eukprot:5558279-Prymnesium_polylepis.1
MRNAAHVIHRAEETRTKARNAAIVLVLSFLLLVVYFLRQRQRQQRQNEMTRLLEETTRLDALDVDVPRLESHLSEGRRLGVSDHVLTAANAKLEEARSRQERRDKTQARLKAVTDQPSLYLSLEDLSAIRKATEWGVRPSLIESAAKQIAKAREQRDQRDQAEARLRKLSLSASPTSPEEATQFRLQLEEALRAAEAAHVSVESAVHKNADRKYKSLLEKEVRCAHRNPAIPRDPRLNTQPCALSFAVGHRFT